MQRKLFLSTIAFILIFSLFLCSCSETTTTSSSSAQPQVTSTTSIAPSTSAPEAAWWDKFGEPTYGGTIKMRMGNLNLSLDPNGMPAGTALFYDNLFIYDWALDRTIFTFNTDYVPVEYVKGLLVETWEQNDPVTVVAHLRPGIHWQNKEPVNGRELVADDVVFHYNRMFGLGNGYTQPSAWWGMIGKFFESITALDKYSVVFKFKQPAAINFFQLTQNPGFNQIEAPEWVALGGPPPTTTAAPGPPGPPGPPGGAAPSGPLTEWQNAVGTGPWLLTDFVAGGSTTFSKNPDYFGYDERYPNNQLPYADQFIYVVIPDISTAVAAQRTGKVDIMTGVNWVPAQQLAKTNPDLLQYQIPASGVSLNFRNDKEPFTDIRVKKALQMSVDRKTIAKTHYGGIVDGTPAGSVSPALKGYTTPYEQWPADLQKNYSYDPAAAKQLLADAGFPNGFSTNIVASSASDLQLLQIIQAQFKDVNVDMEIITMDPAALMSFTLAGKHDAMSLQAEVASTNTPWINLEYTSSLMPNMSFTNDPVFDDMCRAIENTPDQSQLGPLCNKADMYLLEQNWRVALFPTASYNIFSPTINGYNGEMVGSNNSPPGYYARFWVNAGSK